MNTGCESVVPIGGKHGMVCYAIKFWTYVVIMGDIVTAQLTFLGQEEAAIL